ncbi:hypothetical protein H4P12_07150 [Paracoccus sp. 11-3]|uniref:Uncharacterized protein n=1 Tax=Paracoccus amoyensis TaxID=2760093 RepID=A0A926GG73_9RHOB|nr:hypothetical protein [Paracoccus amoyensis]MBC9246492.1 hypothetical protein [Paracoccus amoyensis]
MHKAYTTRTQAVHRAKAIAITRQKNGSVTLPLLLGAAAIVAATLIPQITRAGTFSPPQGCTLTVTVQNRSCTVSQFYQCSHDAAGDQRTAIFDKDGLTYESRIDAETRWMESYSHRTGIKDRLIAEARDHASYSTLLETGMDDFDFWTESNTGERLHRVGQDKLTGRKVTIDGVELEETRFQLTTFNAAGDVLIKRSGQQYINRDLGRFLGGTEVGTDWTGQRTETNDSPVLFSFPDEEGYGETTPQFDCDQMMTQLLQERAQL